MADLATSILGSILTQYTANGLPAPSVSYLCGVREPTAFCDSLAVGWGRMFNGVPGTNLRPQQIKGTFVTRAVEVVVWRFVCLADALSGEGMAVTTFDSAKATADAVAIMTDAYVTHRGLVVSHAAGMFRDFTEGMTVDDMRPLAAEGLMAGWQCNMTFELS